jgi:heat shock protein HslJ
MNIRLITKYKGANMKKQITLVLFVTLALALAACGGGSSSSGSDITGIVWQWSAMQETVPASQSVVPDPENYTITFNDDDTVAIKADCNNVGGNYKLDGSNLTITLGASTLMACGDASQDTIYLASLSKVNSYAVENGQLQLKFPDDGGKMDFTNGGAASQE